MGEDRIADILGDWLEAREAGKPASPEDVIAAHPDLAEKLREHFRILGVVDHAFPAKGLPPASPG